MNALKKVKKLGTSGMVFRRGQQVVLENEKTTEHRAVKVVTVIGNGTKKINKKRIRQKLSIGNT